jgi:hypothetical protein
VEPSVLLIVVQVLLLLVHGHLTGVGAGGANARELKTSVAERVERLLQECVLQVVTGRVAVAHPVVRITALVQCLAEHLATQVNSTTNFTKKK